MSGRTLSNIFCVTLVSAGMVVSTLHTEPTKASHQPSTRSGLTDGTVSHRGDAARSQSPTQVTHKQQAMAVDNFWWASVQKNLAEYEYRPKKIGKGLQASNRAHNLRTYFDSTGIHIQDRTAPRSPKPTSLSHLILNAFSFLHVTILSMLRLIPKKETAQNL